MQSCFQLSLLFYFSFLALSLSVLLHLSWPFSLSRLCFTAQRSMWTLYVAMNLISHGPKSKERRKETRKVAHQFLIVHLKRMKLLVIYTALQKHSFLLPLMLPLRKHFTSESLLLKNRFLCDQCNNCYHT